LFKALYNLQKFIFKVLTAYSPYFEKFFYGPFKEAASGHYEITEPKAEALVTLISIVTGGFDNKKINKDNGITFLEQKSDASNRINLLLIELIIGFIENRKFGVKFESLPATFCINNRLCESIGIPIIHFYIFNTKLKWIIYSPL